MEKKITMLLALMCFVHTIIHAQINGGPPVPTQKCGIYFDYDAAGNRIKRYYDCKDISGGTGDPGGNPNAKIAKEALTQPNKQNSDVTVSPNPTDGKFTIRLSEDRRTHFHLYDSKGAIISSDFIEGQNYNGDITALASGVYVIVVYFHDRPYTFRVVRK